MADEQPALSFEEARSLTERIKAGLAELLPLIREAFQRRADQALGYDSWHTYCDTELRGVRIPVQDRAEAVAQLRQAGMSTRAIGSALGIGNKTAARDLVGTVSTDTVIGLDGGREQPATRPVPPEVSAAVRDAVNEHEREQADRQALRGLADELGLQHDPAAEARRDAATALLYPIFDAVALIAGMPPPDEVIAKIEPYQQWRLDELPGALARLAELTQAWKDYRS